VTPDDDGCTFVHQCLAVAPLVETAIKEGKVGDCWTDISKKNSLVCKDSKNGVIGKAYAAALWAIFSLWAPLQV
jgi:hypothetical protein